MRRTFRGGVHPNDHKELTCARPVRALEPPARVVLPLRQHVGAPAKPLVKAGDLVAEGQPVGEAGGFVSAPVHASIAGKVTAVGKHLHPAGYECEAVTIEALPTAPEGQEWPPQPYRIPGPVPDYQSAEPEKLKALIQAAGIVGIGGAGFPTHVKLSPPKDKPIDTLIINAAECEPFLTCDHRAMLEDSEAIAHGVRIAQRILGVKRVFFGVESNKPDAAEVMRKAFAGDPEVTVTVLQVKYPQGGEKQLIKALTGREVPPPPGLPMDVGCVVQNVSTCATIARAVMEGVPFYERVVTMTGSMVKNPGNYRVRLGTIVGDIVESIGGLHEPPTKVVMGGPMMGMAMAELAVPVVKATSGFIFLSKKEIGDLRPSPCIRCGRCTQACPLLLQPGEMARRVELGDLDAAQSLHVMECMECGTCSYICPSYRWLVQQIRLGKAKLNERKQKSA
ncbi:MAG TPA: electron transport complex subunit RsxC [Myxococcales bacterium]|nr:electron transport complex subunit RsxC [Myxococcales bacterium]